MASANRLVQLCRQLGGEVPESLREDVAQAWMDADAYRLSTARTVSRMNDGEVLGAEMSLNKIFWSELDVRLHSIAMHLLGDRAELSAQAPSASATGRWSDDWLFSLPGPIWGGANEIQRNIVAERVLGLPRERR